MDDLTAVELFGFVPEELYREIYAVGYNEFLAAISSLRITLLGQFPNSKKEVEQGCSLLLARYNEHFDQRFTMLMQYLAKNIFVVPRHISVYKTDMANLDTSKEALFRVKELRYRIMATQYLNTKLLQCVQDVDAKIAKREALSLEIGEAERKGGKLKKIKEIKRKLQEAVYSLQLTD